MRTIAWASATAGARRSISSSPWRRRCRAPVIASKTITYHIVTRGLDPRVHHSWRKVFAKEMDGRVKPGHDGASGTHIRHRGLDHTSRIYPTCALKFPNSGKPEFGWSIIFGKNFLPRGWIAGS